MNEKMQNEKMNFPVNSHIQHMYVHRMYSTVYAVYCTQYTVGSRIFNHDKYCDIIIV